MAHQYLLRGYASSILTILTCIQLFSLTLSTLTLVKELQIHSGPITNVHYSSDFSQFVTVSSAEYKFIIWDSITLEFVAEKTLLSTINSVGLNSLTN
jgi:WD40 repeat protein